MYCCDKIFLYFSMQLRNNGFFSVKGIMLYVAWHFSSMSCCIGILFFYCTFTTFQAVRIYKIYIDCILFFFVSNATEGTQWTHPRTGKKKVVSGGEEYSVH